MGELAVSTVLLFQGSGPELAKHRPPYAWHAFQSGTCQACTARRCGRFSSRTLARCRFKDSVLPIHCVELASGTPWLTRFLGLFWYQPLTPRPATSKSRLTSSSWTTVEDSTTTALLKDKMRTGSLLRFSVVKLPSITGIFEFVSHHSLQSKLSFSSHYLSLYSGLLQHLDLLS